LLIFVQRDYEFEKHNVSCRYGHNIVHVWLITTCNGNGDCFFRTAFEVAL